MKVLSAKKKVRKPIMGIKNYVHVYLCFLDGPLELFLCIKQLFGARTPFMTWSNPFPKFGASNCITPPM